MRILYTHRLQAQEGRDVRLDGMVTALLQAGHHVLVMGPGDAAASRRGKDRLLPGALGELAELARAWIGYPRLAKAARSFRPDVVYGRHSLFDMAPATLARRRRIPLYLEVIAPGADEREDLGPVRLRRLAEAVERRIWRSATRIFPVSGVLRNRIAAAGIPNERIEVLHNAVRPDRFEPRARRRESGIVTLGFIGVLRETRGLDRVIRAMASLGGGAALRLTVAGDGPARAALEQLAATMGLFDHAQFLGAVDHALMPWIVDGFDIAVLPTVPPYASPPSLFEYMATGVAIVAPDRPNIREILADQRTALLFDPDRNGAMEAAISRLVADAGMRRQLGEAARARLLACRHDWTANAERLVNSMQAESNNRG